MTKLKTYVLTVEDLMVLFSTGMLEWAANKTFEITDEGRLMINDKGTIRYADELEIIDYEEENINA